MKQVIVGLSILSIVGTAVAARADITIGVNLSSTGPAASLGIPEKNAISFGPSTIAGQKVRYVVYDDATDTTNAVMNVKRLISEEKVDLLIGPTTVPTAMAVVETVAESRTPMIQLCPGPTAISPADAKRKWIFNVPANNDIYASATVNHMIKQKVKTVSVIAVEDAYGETSTAAFRKIAEPKGIRILTVEKYKRTDTSATAQVLHALQGNPDAVYIISSGTPAAMPHRILIERGYKGIIHQSGATANSDFLRVGGKAVDGAYLPASPVLVAEQMPDGYPTKKTALEFATAYEGKFGPRAHFASLAWDALKIMEGAVPVALKSAKPGTEQFRAALRDAIEQTRGLKGSGAVFTMSGTDHSGVNQLGLAMVRIENGKWKLDSYADFK
jgi:branched-chain amino acid transport system substrate-binding protein